MRKFALGVIVGWIFFLMTANFIRIPYGETEVVRREIIDTIPYRKPIPVDSVVVRYKERVILRYDTIKITKVDTAIYRSEDSTKIFIPIVQKHYKDDKYEAWVSGYKPSLDSLNVFSTTRTETIINGATRQQKGKWGLGVQVGACINAKKVEPYIGIGISYNFLSW